MENFDFAARRHFTYHLSFNKSAFLEFVRARVFKLNLIYGHQEKNFRDEIELADTTALVADVSAEAH
jgi:hypothetical protein